MNETGPRFDANTNTQPTPEKPIDVEAFEKVLRSLTNKQIMALAQRANAAFSPRNLNNPATRDIEVEIISKCVDPEYRYPSFIAQVIEDCA